MVTLRPHLPLHFRASPIQPARTETAEGWWHELSWIAAAAVVGFTVTAITSWWLDLSRAWLVAIYAPSVFTLFAAYVHVNNVDLRTTFLQRWRWGVAIGLVVAALLLLTIQRQDASPRPEGWQLIFDIAWLGVVYGVADALLMNVLPVLVTWRVARRRGWTRTTWSKIGAGALALVASLIVTVAYHAGYAEFQGVEMRDPAIGNTINTLAYILANNPIASLVSHVAMHIAAVFHGAGTTVQLPPHY
jgi:hypothetical protein